MTIFLIKTTILAVVAAIAYWAGRVTVKKEVMHLVNGLDDLVKRRADKMVDRLLKQEIGKTLAGVNDGKRYSWKLCYDHDGESHCDTMRFGVDCRLSDVVNMVNRRAIEWGCDITRIEIAREDCT